MLENTTEHRATACGLGCPAPSVLSTVPYVLYLVFQVIIVFDLLLFFAEYPGVKGASYVDDKAGSFFVN